MFFPCLVTVLFYNHCGGISVHHIAVVPVGIHGDGVAHHALFMGSDRSRQSLVLKGLLVIAL
jgi:hypothetical protein